MKNLKKFSAIFAIFLLLFSTACVETIVAGSVAAGMIATREKNLSHTHSDIAISTKIAMHFLASGLKNPGNSVDVTVTEGRVLLTGIVRDEEKAKSASELAWKVKGVKEVIDEIQLQDGFNFKNISTAARDYVISAEIESKLLLARGVSSANYQITTVSRTVYLLGIADNSAEMQKVLDLAAKVRGVEKVVNHVILASDSRRNG
jgi:osmotically-inducible protein OsmY